MRTISSVVGREMMEVVLSQGGCRTKTPSLETVLGFSRTPHARVHSTNPGIVSHHRGEFVIDNQVGKDALQK